MIAIMYPRVPDSILIPLYTVCSSLLYEKYIKTWGDTTMSGGKKESVAHILTYEYLKSICEEKEVSEIAEETGCGRSTVRKYLHKFNLPVKNSRKGKLVGENNPSWKGGRYKKPNGYVMVNIAPGEYTREHVLVIEQHIGRKLFRDEVVHHLDGNRSNNQLINLMLLTKKEHDRYHMICRNKRIDYRNHEQKDVLKILGIDENVCRPFTK